MFKKMDHIICSIYFYLFYFFMGLVNNSPLLDNLELDYNDYDDGCGTKWIYFPDGNGTAYYINLTITEDDTPNIPNSAFDDIKYRLYYLRNDTDSYILLDGLGKAMDKVYQKITNDVLLTKMPLKILTHGWRSSVEMIGVLNMKNAYLETRKVNVITVDWSTTAKSILYHSVANETKAVGAKVALFLDQLNHSYNVTGKQIHLIGHSLGAHIMGIAASKSKINISRITGLDPARPLFEFPPQENSARLDSSDAEFVDVIHTCRGLLGYEAPLGTVDFYPNNGAAPQPGCDILKFYEACSHGRSYNYFIESIKYTTSFPAYQCQSLIDYFKNQCIQNGYMGEGVSRKMSGTYYLRTNAFEPYGRRV